MRLASALAFAVLAAAGSAHAAPPPPPELIVQAPGKDVATLTRRALICIPQNTQPGFVDVPAIVSSDVAGGLVVANNAFDYEDKGFLRTLERGRSTLTFEAKEGRFRISHSNVEGFMGAMGWRPYTSKFLSARLERINEAVAACVSAATEASSW